MILQNTLIKIDTFIGVYIKYNCVFPIYLTFTENLKIHVLECAIGQYDLYGNASNITIENKQKKWKKVHKALENL